LEDGYDLIVVGGGPSGVAAAIAAGRMGRKVALIERTGCLGGLGTSGLVNVFMPFADGENTLMGGIGIEFVRQLHARGFVPPGVSPDLWEQGQRRALGFNGEGLKLLMDELALGAGIEIRFFTSLIDVIGDGAEVKAVVLASGERLYAMRAPYYVDATGDAALSAMAGLPFEVGDEEGNTQAPTLCSAVANIDYERYARFRDETRRPGDWQPLIVPLRQAIADGVFSEPELHLPGIFFTGGGHGILNAGHIYGLDCLSDDDLTQGMMVGRAKAQEYMTFYRNYVQGCEQMSHIATASILGVRETRRILGEYVLNVDDFVACRSFDDEIGRYNYPIDIHRSTPSLQDYEQLVEEFTRGYRLSTGESYGIPYRSLLPRGADNLLVSGRCISTDRLVQGSIRVMPCCFITGQAAGTAAALCGMQDIATSELDVGLLRRTLKDRGAYLP
jgi:hypothetical protein